MHKCGTVRYKTIRYIYQRSKADPMAILI